MSFVSKGEKKMHNMVKKGGSTSTRGATKDSFGRKGDGDRAGAPHNVAPGSKDKASEPVSEDASHATPDASKVVKSEYDPASGKRAKSVADLRNAQKLITERSMAGEASPTGSEGGEDAKHTSSSKNNSGFMKGSTMSKMDKQSQKKPRGQANQMAGDSEMEDPMDEDEDDSGQAEEGMTPSGKSRKSGLKVLKRKMAM